MGVMKYAGVMISSIFAIFMFATNGFLAGRIGNNTSTAVEFAAAPQGWAFSIWGLIYFFQAAWIIYVWYLNCRNSSSYDDQDDDKSTSPFFPFRFHAVFALGCAFNATWVLIVAQTDPNLLVNNVVPFFMIVFLAVCLAYCLSIVLDIDDASRTTVYDVIVVNAFALYLPWVGLVAPVVSIGSMVNQFGSLGDPDVSYLTLGLIAGGVLVMWILEFGSAWGRERFGAMYLQYYTLLNGIAGILTKGVSTANTVSVLALVLFLLVAVGLVVKIVMGCCCMQKAPEARGGFQAV